MRYINTKTNKKAILRMGIPFLVFALLLSLFSVLFQTNTVQAASSEAEKACKKEFDLIGYPDKYLGVCYYGYDALGSSPDFQEKCGEKYPPASSIEKNTACNKGATLARADNQPPPGKKGLIKFEAADPQNHPVEDVGISVNIASCDVTVVATDSNGKAELNCFDNREYKATYSPPDGGKILSKTTENVKVGNTYQIKAEINDELIDEAEQACSDRLLDEGALKQDIEACVDGYLAAHAGEKMNKACAGWAEPFKRSCETGYDLGRVPDKNDSCGAEASFDLSWVMCPMIEWARDGTKFFYDELIVPLLKDVPVSTRSGNGTYEAWQSFRVLGNIALVGALMALVYGAAKGGGE